ncbi:MAG: D-alanyl-D-alanine carboxypeptidase family protein [Tabrizicola sp.]|uniref:D-alanyl-D-alanine carboxypeptidase family protein n=1 Tax=Tabrizicola sp. TaxID=2005166 RepID=UPI0027332604|nr:D-alanyl-D-alanine carboxypeptidase family protein [Tabrizicola sp.]MDP3264226.1 D-alanyl-D-alanine carboxypeptidase family protein [Tabrizicola sp.]MDZ4067414.1 D-alanyl-D-alanine carboxypeptidase family protein [Tabrizicola sp.]
MFQRLRLALPILMLFAAALPARAFETVATAAWVYDMTTKTVLMDKNADQSVPPASMSKLMTINMLFEALRDGRVTLDSTFSVSQRAKSMGGSTMFLQETDRPTVDELIHGMIINSGNDACVVVAEGLAGTEEAFAAQMTERGRAIGMTASVFTNSSGWPDPNHRMSMRDLGILGQRLIEEFPEYYPVFAKTEFNYKDRAPDNRFNRNPLLKLGIGADGLKTGHTSEAGYGLVGSARQGNRRIVFAITGLPSDIARAEEAERIVSWAFRQFAEKTVARTGVRVAEAEVFMGTADRVGLVPAADVRLLVPALVQESMTAEVVYKGPLIAPVTAGSQVAELIIHVPDLPDHKIPLVAETDVPEAGFMRRLATAASALYSRYMGEAPAS